MKIIETKDRSILSEGRSSGMGFAFLKKEEDVYSTVNPLSPCKDYLNEVVFTENTGFPTKAHGLEYPQKNDIFDDFGYLAIKIVSNCGNENYSYSKSKDVDQEQLKTNYKNIQKLLNHFEKELSIKTKSKITKSKDDYFLVKAPKEWCKSTINISLYTLLIRTSMVYDGHTEPIEFLENYKYNIGDQALLKQAIPKFKEILKNKQLPEQPKFDEKSAKLGKFCPHNLGILSHKV